MRRFIGPMLFATVLGAGFDAQALDLEKPKARQGYYVGTGLRLALGTASGEDLGSLGTVTGFGFGFRFGEMATENFGLGLAFGGGGGGNEDWTVGGGNLSLEFMYTPVEALNLAIRSSIGLGFVSTARIDENAETEDDPQGGLGALYTVGASYDFFPFYEEDQYESGGWALTAFADLQFLPAGEVTTKSFILGVEITWWSGLDRNKLDLPTAEAFKVDE